MILQWTHVIIVATSGKTSVHGQFSLSMVSLAVISEFSHLYKLDCRSLGKIHQRHYDKNLAATEVDYSSSDDTDEKADNDHVHARFSRGLSNAVGVRLPSRFDILAGCGRYWKLESCTRLDSPYLIHGASILSWSWL
jgi:hypothetical protein